MREIDRLTIERYGTPSLTLMEAAASTTARSVTDRFGGEIVGRRILVLCGRGNNGGDGAATARLLAIEGAKVDVVLFGKVQDTKADARTNFERLHTWNDERAIREEHGASPSDFGSISFFECVSETGWDQLRASLLSVPHDVTIDALLGTGTTRPIAGLNLEGVRYVRGLREMRDSIDGPRLLIVSVDLPSGLNSDSNEPIGEAVHADVTVTMTAPKPANVLPPAPRHNGALTGAGIGSPRYLVATRGA